MRPEAAVAGQRGFTLLEVLVAFIIAALALAALFQGATGGLQATRAAGQYQEAISRARSHLAAVGRGSAIVPGSQQGEEGHGFRWRVTVAQLGSVPVARGDAVTMARGPRAVLYGVTVTMAWTDGAARAVTLETQRVGIAPPAPP